MKKLIIVLIAITFLNLIGTAVLIRETISYNGNNISIADTSINRIQIDSIQLIIKQKDSIIYNIIEEIEYEKIKADGLNDNDAVDLFKELLSK